MASIKRRRREKKRRFLSCPFCRTKCEAHFGCAAISANKLNDFSEPDRSWAALASNSTQLVAVAVRGRSTQRRGLPAGARSYCSASRRYRSFETQTSFRPSICRLPKTCPCLPTENRLSPISSPSTFRCSLMRSGCKPRMETAQPSQPRPLPGRLCPSPRCRFERHG